MNTETTAAGNSLPEKEAPIKSGRSSPVVMTSTTNFVQLQSDCKNRSKENTSYEIDELELVS
jgi:hypothetical protein